MIDTEHYGLHKPEDNDYYNQENENENMDAIDAALHELETGKETPEGAQEKADQAKEEAISACRPADWIPNSEEIGPAIKEVIEGQKGKANGLASLGSSGTIPSARFQRSQAQNFLRFQSAKAERERHSGRQTG